MFLVCCLCVVPLLARATPVLDTECQNLSGSEPVRCRREIVDHKEEISLNTENNGTDALLEETGRSVDDEGRTWRVNKKSLVPILVGMTVKALAMLALSLFVLTLMGSVSILLSKVSLLISGGMFLKRFFSKDATAGGFFGLNPLAFPQSSLNQQDFFNNVGSKSGMSYATHGRAVEEQENIVRGLSDYASKIDKHY